MVGEKPMTELLVTPTREEFKRLAQSSDIIPVLAHFVADTVTPVSVLMALQNSGDCFLLESVEGGDRWARYSFVGCRPLATISSRNGRVDVDGPLTVSSDKGMLSALDDLVSSLKVADVAGVPPLHSGLVGALGWDTIREIEDLECTAEAEASLFDSAMMVIGDLVAFDHWKQSVT